MNEEINVSKCKYYVHNQMGNCCITHNSGFSMDCDKNDCYYKQLQQLKEENKELRQVRKDLPDVQQPYVILYRQLKRENHELRKTLKENKDSFNDVCVQLLKKEQKLEKIKGICLKNHCNAQIAHSGCGYDYLILQIIEGAE